MSRAFVKESDRDDEMLPDREVSPHPNFVTARGLAQLEARVRDLEQERSAARAVDDSGAMARTMASASSDSPRPRTKLLSILILSNGKLRR